MTTQTLPRLSLADWRAEAEHRFGPDTAAWRFACPACGHVASVQDYQDAGAPEGAVAFSCIGRYGLPAREAFGDGPGPCNYAGGGLFRLNPVVVVTADGREHERFAFADAEDCSAP